MSYSQALLHFKGFHAIQVGWVGGSVMAQFVRVLRLHGVRTMLHYPIHSATHAQFLTSC